MKIVKNNSKGVTVHFSPEELPDEIWFRCPICDTSILRYMKKADYKKLNKKFCCSRYCYAQLRKKTEMKVKELK